VPSVAGITPAGHRRFAAAARLPTFTASARPSRQAGSRRRHVPDVAPHRALRAPHLSGRETGRSAGRRPTALDDAQRRARVRSNRDSAGVANAPTR
jgi:hypothetical protein